MNDTTNFENFLIAIEQSCPSPSDRFVPFTECTPKSPIEANLRLSVTSIFGGHYEYPTDSLKQEEKYSQFFEENALCLNMVKVPDLSLPTYSSEFWNMKA